MNRILILACLGSFLVSAVAESATISVNFTGGGGPGDGGVKTLTTADVAGVIPVANWQNYNGANGGVKTALIDSTGAITAATLEPTLWNGTYTAHTTGVSPNGNTILTNGYIDNSNADVGTGVITMTNIPYAKYDVYVYIGGNDDGFRQGTGTIGATTYHYITNTAAFNNSSTFTRALGTFAGDPNGLGQYMRFENVTGSSFVYTQFRGANDNSGLHGIQVVQVPEPSGLLALGLGAMGLLAVARRRKGKCLRAK